MRVYSNDEIANLLEKIDLIRCKFNLNQKQLLRKLGISHQSFTKIIKGKPVGFCVHRKLIENLNIIMNSIEQVLKTTEKLNNSRYIQEMKARFLQNTEFFTGNEFFLDVLLPKSSIFILNENNEYIDMLPQGGVKDILFFPRETVLGQHVLHVPKIQGKSDWWQHKAKECVYTKMKAVMNGFYGYETNIGDENGTPWVVSYECYERNGQKLIFSRNNNPEADQYWSEMIYNMDVN